MYTTLRASVMVNMVLVQFVRTSWPVESDDRLPQHIHASHRAPLLS